MLCGGSECRMLSWNVSSCWACVHGVLCCSRNSSGPNLVASHGSSVKNTGGGAVGSGDRTGGVEGGSCPGVIEWGSHCCWRRCVCKQRNPLMLVPSSISNNQPWTSVAGMDVVMVADGRLLGGSAVESGPETRFRSISQSSRSSLYLVQLWFGFWEAPWSVQWAGTF